MDASSFHTAPGTPTNDGSSALSNGARSAGTSPMTSAYTLPASATTPSLQLDSVSPPNTSDTPDAARDEGLSNLVAGVKVGRKNWVRFGFERTMQGSIATQLSMLTSINDNEDRSPASLSLEGADPLNRSTTQSESTSIPRPAQGPNHLANDSTFSRTSRLLPGRLLSVHVGSTTHPTSQSPSKETTINPHAPSPAAPPPNPVVSSHFVSSPMPDRSKRQSAPPIQADADAQRLHTLIEQGQDHHIFRSSSSSMRGGRLRSVQSVTHFAPPSYGATTQADWVEMGSDSILSPEEEGQELLPPYTSWVHLEGYLPRKMEFSAPGAPSNDRSWRRYYFVLHGTSLTVYQGNMSAVVPRLVALDAFQPLKGPLASTEPIIEDETSAANTKPINSTSMVNTASHAAQQVRHAIHRPPHLTRSSSTRRGTSLELAFSPLSVFAEEADASLHDAQRQAMADRASSNQPGTGAHFTNLHAVGSDPFGANFVRTYSLQEAETGLACD